MQALRQEVDDVLTQQHGGPPRATPHAPPSHRPHKPWLTQHAPSSQVATPTQPTSTGGRRGGNTGMRPRNARTAASKQHPLYHSPASTAKKQQLRMSKLATGQHAQRKLGGGGIQSLFATPDRINSGGGGGGGAATPVAQRLGMKECIEGCARCSVHNMMCNTGILISTHRWRRHSSTTPA